ncbi:S4 domain-containing protein [Rhizobium sp. BR 362]|uniref:S4 domain-containing protein n=1 Tax=Rhizobium sp. BR 362 TaxID=3040670 RepID=UPI002F42FCB3
MCMENRAYEATALTHGADAAKQAETTAKQTFGQGEAAEGLPTLELDNVERVCGVALVELLVRTGLAVSKGEARRAISGRGIRINGDIIEDLDLVISAQGLPTRLSLGRKRHVVVK